MPGIESNESSVVALRPFEEDLVLVDQAKLCFFATLASPVHSVVLR